MLFLSAAASTGRGARVFEFGRLPRLLPQGFPASGCLFFCQLLRPASHQFSRRRGEVRSNAAARATGSASALASPMFQSRESRGSRPEEKSVPLAASGVVDLFSRVI